MSAEKFLCDYYGISPDLLWELINFGGYNFRLDGTDLNHKEALPSTGGLLRVGPYLYELTYDNENFRHHLKPLNSNSRQKDIKKFLEEAGVGSKPSVYAPLD